MASLRNEMCANSLPQLGHVLNPQALLQLFRYASTA